MRGLANGLILAKGIMLNQEPVYFEAEPEYCNVSGEKLNPSFKATNEWYKQAARDEDEHCNVSGAKLGKSEEYQPPFEGEVKGFGQKIKLGDRVKCTTCDSTATTEKNSLMNSHIIYMNG